MTNKLRMDNSYHDVTRVEITNGRLEMFDNGGGWDYIDVKLYDDESDVSYGINAHSFRIYGPKNVKLEFTDESKELKPFIVSR